MKSQFPIIQSASGFLRLEAASAFLARFPADQPITIVAATRGAADDLARRVARARGATIGLARFSLTQVAARAAATRLVGRGIAPATPLGSEAVAARASFDAAREGTLDYLAAVVRMPGFPRALAHTIADLRAVGMTAERLADIDQAGPDLARLLARIETELVQAATADRARLAEVAIEGFADDRQLAGPLLLLDVAMESAVDARLVAALVARASAVCATVPAHDATAREALERAGGVLDERGESGDGDLAYVRRYLFAEQAPAPRDLDGSLEFFSAPGEGRECIEIARRVLREAKRGVPFDEMAILVHSPHHYQGLLEHALHRAGIPAWFDRGTRRPHPAGRAFLALLACAAEGLSARRFAEYLSLGQLPPSESASAPPASWVPSQADELFPSAARHRADDGEGEDEEGAGTGPPAATLRTPRRWEQLLVEAAVIGGDPARWVRRFDGLEEEFRRRLDEARREDQDSPRADAIGRDLDRLDQLRQFALPLVAELADWPASAAWGVWLDRLSALAPRVLRTPAYVLRVLADLRPMAAVGPVSLAEVRGVLAERLRLVDAEPPARRYGRVLVAAPVHARGRTFRAVFVPGLAERMFPQKLRQDPLLGDTARGRLDAALTTRSERARRERLLLHLAAGAATERLFVSYPRLEVAEGRSRVPSFYALDLLRGATGRIPDHETLAADAAQAGDRSLAWPAPGDPATAIDDQEHDLAVLRRLLDTADPAQVRGHAHYLLRDNAALKRSVTERWARGERRWSHFDGLIRVTPATRDALAAQRLGARPYSLSALQRFAACPYQFLLGAIYRLQPSEQPLPMQRLDALTKGSFVHRVQALFLRELDAAGALPVTAASLDAALVRLDEVLARVAADYAEQLVPAIPRVWRDEIEALARDLRGWVQAVARETDGWIPRYFELGFGLSADAARDPQSSVSPVRLADRYVLHGAVDLVEARSDGTLRVTDHKTGRNRHKQTLVTGGGAVLQPVLYSLAVEQLLGATVTDARLFFCTSAGGYSSSPVRLTPDARRAGLEALEIVDRAIEQGTLAAAPADGACARCDFTAVCGPNEEARVRRKPAAALADLIALRSRP